MRWIRSLAMTIRDMPELNKERQEKVCAAMTKMVNEGIFGRIDKVLKELNLEPEAYDRIRAVVKSSVSSTVIGVIGTAIIEMGDDDFVEFICELMTKWQLMDNLNS
jgi:hypothetical protein